DVKYPVIHISFGAGVLDAKEKIKDRIEKNFKDVQELLDIKCEKLNNMAICFSELIQKAYEKYNQKVVVLVDEYDKPILDNIDNIEMAKVAREELKNIYSVIKDSDEYIKFAFLTGVSKFSKASIFSGLNNIQDITLDCRYSLVCGYRQSDLESSFIEYLENVDLEKVKSWYNGYSWGEESVYNPFDILLFLDNPKKEFKNYWFETGTPTFLMKLIETNNYFLPRLSNLVVGEQLLNSFDIENLDLEVILYQTGYLTIEKAIEKSRGGYEYKLKLPNKEVKLSLNDYIINYIIKTDRTNSSNIQDNIYECLKNQDLETFKTSLISLFASIPYNNYTNNQMHNSEGFYATVIYVYLQSLGVEIIGEDVTNRGRIDLTIKFLNSIYILEFKITDEEPLAQIKAKKYYEKYLSEKKDIFLVGIKFDRFDKNIKEFVWERLKL
ncbi:MAG: AAA family ATPase, partial [Epsilonproteobacteria bacterium]|nr:AAA family ATPase [Campylobacterota bacterium]